MAEHARWAQREALKAFQMPVHLHRLQLAELSFVSFEGTVLGRRRLESGPNLSTRP